MDKASSDTEKLAALEALVKAGVTSYDFVPPDGAPATTCSAPKPAPTYTEPPAAQATDCPPARDI
jgi:hypothetical protein